MSAFLFGIGLVTIGIGLFVDAKSIFLNLKKNRKGIGSSGLPLFGLLLYIVGLFLLPSQSLIGVHKGIVFLVLLAFHVIAQYLVVLVKRGRK